MVSNEVEKRCVCVVWAGGGVFQQLFQCKMGTGNDKNKLKLLFGLILVVRNGETIITPGYTPNKRIMNNWLYITDYIGLRVL